VRPGRRERTGTRTRPRRLFLRRFGTAGRAG